LLGWSIAHRTPVIVDDPAKDPRHAIDIAKESGVRPQHIMVAPLADGDDVIGAVGVSGAPGGDKDAVCAQAGIDRIKGGL